MAALLYRIGRACARRSWFVIGAWVLVLVLAGVAYALFHGTITSAITIPGTATSKVADQLAQKFPAANGGTGTLVMTTTDGSAFTTEQQAQIGTLLDQIATIDGVSGVVNPFTTEQQRAHQEQQVTAGQAQLAQGQTQLKAAQDQVDQGTAQLDAAQAQLDAAKAQAAAAGAAGAAQQAQLAAQQAQLDAQRAQLQQGQAALDQQKAQLEAGAAQAEQGATLLRLASGVRTVSKDGSAATAIVRFDEPAMQVDPATKQAVATAAEDARIAGVEIHPANDITQEVPSVLGVGEVVGVVIAAIVLIVMLGTLIGAGLPLLSALLGVAVASLGSLAFSGLVDFISVTPVLGVMLGLAVGIDYSLFILNRHRRQLRQGMGVPESVGLANGTSGNAVVFAGSTVIVALLALNVTGIPFLGLMGTVAAVAILVAILVATTFTPAVLGLAGTRLLRRRERAHVGDPAAARVPDAPMSSVRAVVTLVLGVVVLGVLAIPAASMRLGLPDGSGEATSSSQYKAFTIVRDRFGAGQNGPLLVVANLAQPLAQDRSTAAQVAVAEKIAAQHGVVGVAPVGTSQDGTVIAFQVIPTGGPTRESTTALVRDLRALPAIDAAGTRATLGVAGNASANIDVSAKLAAALPVYLVVVVGLSLVILILVFRSILVPVTATAGFVLSLFASFGGLTAIYQWGWLRPVFGVHDPAPILSFLPVIVMGILFGLAMDYQLFLVSGMRESYVHGSVPRLAVQRGLHAGRSVVTAAAIIMISVFGGFVFSESAIIRPIGFGLAFGVLVDAFVVRMLLIPAAMHLLGGSAWWLPRWLDRLLPDVDVEGARLERSHPLPGHEPEAAPAAPPADPETAATV